MRYMSVSGRKNPQGFAFSHSPRLLIAIKMPTLCVCALVVVIATRVFVNGNDFSCIAIYRPPMGFLCFSWKGVHKRFHGQGQNQFSAGKLCR